jgi:cation:H+ antiporter
LPAWLVFLLSGAVVVLAGIRLSRDGDAIADRTGLGGAWVGAILVAAATSLPELTTDLYAVRQGTSALAAGDLFGSSMANMLILAIADLATRQVRVLTRVAINQALVGSLAIALTATAAAGTLTAQDLTVLGIGWAPLAIVFGYAAGMRVLYLNRPEPPFETPAEATQAAREAPELRRAALGFGLAALVIILVARYLAGSAAELAEQLGISTGFAGIVLLAITTSLPELVVSLESVRRGSYDLAVGNLLGSNCFNMVILVFLDVADGPGSLLAQVGPEAPVGALFAILLMGQVLMEVLHRAERRVWYLEPNALLLAGMYLGGVYLTYQAGR